MNGRFCNDIRNIITLIEHCYRLDCLNKEYRQVFWFFDTDYNDLDNYNNDNACPNPQGRCVIKYQNAKLHFLNGKRHRIDKPAVELASYKEWYWNGQLHRPTSEGPAYEHVNGEKFWYCHGKRHRTTGPAIEFANGEKFWFVNDKLQRIENPAVEYANRPKWPKRPK